MKKLIFMGLFLLTLTGCGKVENTISHFKSKWIGIDRVITLYSADGKVIETWQSDNQVEYVGGFARFIDKSGKVITISGTIVMSEKI